MSFQYFDVAVGYFVEILLEIKAKRERVCKLTECSDVLVECKLLAAVGE